MHAAPAAGASAPAAHSQADDHDERVDDPVLAGGAEELDVARELLRQHVVLLVVAQAELGRRAVLLLLMTRLRRGGIARRAGSHVQQQSRARCGGRRPSGEPRERPAVHRCFTARAVAATTAHAALPQSSRWRDGVGWGQPIVIVNCQCMN
jgi:hypothetical protein